MVPAVVSVVGAVVAGGVPAVPQAAAGDRRADDGTDRRGARPAARVHGVYGVLRETGWRRGVRRLVRPAPCRCRQLLADEPAIRRRLVRIQWALIDLIDFLDPSRRRLPTEHRKWAPDPAFTAPDPALTAPDPEFHGRSGADACRRSGSGPTRRTRRPDRRHVPRAPVLRWRQRPASRRVTAVSTSRWSDSRPRATTT